MRQIPDKDEPLRKDGDRIREMFSRIARRYDLNNRLHSLGRDQAWRRLAAEMAGVQVGESALDVACGTGDLTAILAKQLHLDHRRDFTNTGRIVGADFCREMLEIAHKKFPHLPIEWLLADAQALPLEDGSFDVITIAFGLRNLPQPERALAEFWRLLRPGGRLVVLEFVRDGLGSGGRAIAWFTRHVMTHTASIIAQDREGAYDYLHKSVQSFLSAAQLGRLLADHGYENVQTRRMTFGVVAICRGSKKR